MVAVTGALAGVVGAASFASAYTALGGLDERAAGRRAARAGEALARLGRRVAPARQDVGPQIPVMLDIVTLGLSAGLSFDSSLELYCERYHDALALALGRERLRWQLGVVTRAEGLRVLAGELEQPSLGELAGVVEESLELGLPLAGTLEREAGQLRAEQRSRVEERIEQVPVRMLIPLGTLIVPAMLMAILGPLVGSAVGIG